jgi:molybdopterin molybdotransferase
MSETHVENLTVQEAVAAVLAPIAVLPAEQVELPEALGRVLAAPIVARDQLPPFANSAMDGFALMAADVVEAAADRPVSLRVVGDVAAGSAPEGMLERGTAVRIMTGASIPFGADAVVPVEDTDENWRDRTRPLPTTIQIRRSVRPGDFVRRAGGDVAAGQTVLQAGHHLRPPEIGLLASLGMATVAVVRRPLVGILATGDELIPVTEPLQPGKIRNSNGYAQAAQVAALGAIPLSLGIARDTESDVRERLQEGLNAGVDLFISSAGVSVGAYDVVKAVLEAEGNIGFWRVRMRPGKPLAFGTYKSVPYLGLPGNPVSAMVSFERFARAVILKMAGHTKLERPQIMAEIQVAMESDGRESYIRAVVEKQDGRYIATPTGEQESHMLTSLVKANALLIIPEGTRQIEAGEQLVAWMLDWPETVF